MQIISTINQVIWRAGGGTSNKSFMVGVCAIVQATVHIYDKAAIGGSYFLAVQMA